MNGLHSYAYFNQWRTIHPRDKLAFALVSMVLCVFSPLMIPPLLALLICTFIIVAQAKIPAGIYFKFFTVPLGFIIIGALSVALSITSAPSLFLWDISVGPYTVGMTGQGLHHAMLLTAKSSGAVACLLLLALTTPIEDLAWQLERCRIPYLFIELITLVFRFIFVFWEQALGIHTAQAARLGHMDVKTGLRSLAFLASSLFLNVIHRSNALYNGLVSRNYSDSLRVLKEEPPATPTMTVVGFLAVDALLLGLIFYRGSGLI